MTDVPPKLSPAGQARREAILRHTLRSVRRRRYRRRTLRASGGLAAIALAAVLVHYTWRPGTPTTPPWTTVEVAQRAESSAESTPPGGRGTPLVTIIRPDPTICERLAAPELPPTWQTIDDARLLAALSEVGQEAGLVRINGQTLLLVHN